jgi:hypothetical protein
MTARAATILLFAPALFATNRLLISLIASLHPANFVSKLHGRNLKILYFSLVNFHVASLNDLLGLSSPIISSSYVSQLDLQR